MALGMEIWSAGLSVYHIDPDSNISTTTECIAITFSTDINCPRQMNPNDHDFDVCGFVSELSQ